MLLKLVPLLLLVAISFSHQGHQERANRLVPGFQPYDHPSQKAVGGPPSKHSGPIGDVEWVEGRGHGEGGVPVFGSIKPTPPSTSTTISSSLLLLLLLGGVGAAALLKGKTAGGPVAASKNEEAKEERRGRAGNEEPVDDLASTERLQPKKSCVETTTLSLACPILPTSSFREEGKSHEMPTTTPPKEVITSPMSRAEVKCEEKTKVKDRNDSETRKEEKIRKEKANEEDTSIPVPKENAVEGEVTPKEKTRIVPEIIVSPEVPKEVVPVQMEAESVNKTEQSRTPSVKTRFEDLPINLTTVDELEEVDYITKIKTFKITRWPKTHTADLVQHGPESLLSVLLPLQLQKCDEWKPDVKTFSADLSIEGANISRLLITVVTEKGEEESVAKTMTIKEYLVSISNKIIEDAVKAVREDCSLENIKCLAETIKKYRPESMEVKNVRKL